MELSSASDGRSWSIQVSDVSDRRGVPHAERVGGYAQLDTRNPMEKVPRPREVQKRDLF